jgi:hypothetical protein
MKSQDASITLYEQVLPLPKQLRIAEPQTESHAGRAKSQQDRCWLFKVVDCVA